MHYTKSILERLIVGHVCDTERNQLYTQEIESGNISQQSNVKK